MEELLVDLRQNEVGADGLVLVQTADFGFEAINEVVLVENLQGETLFVAHKLHNLFVVEGLLAFQFFIFTLVETELLGLFLEVKLE